VETWDVICARRNVRQSKLEPVSDDDLNRIAEGPDGGHRPRKTASRGTS
jgi:hypothetical protein